MAAKDKFYEGLPEIKTMDDKEEGNGKGKGKGKGNYMDDILQKLPHCDTIKKIDELSVQCCKFMPNEFIVRVGNEFLELIEGLYDVPTVEMVPFYSRMIATLSTFWPNFGRTMYGTLYKFYIPIKDIPIKDRDGLPIFFKYIDELCKFKVITLTEVLDLCKVLVSDIDEDLEAVVLFMETCGETLIRSGGHEMPLIVEQIKRAKEKKSKEEAAKRAEEEERKKEEAKKAEEKARKEEAKKANEEMRKKQLAVNRRWAKENKDKKKLRNREEEEQRKARKKEEEVEEQARKAQEEKEKTAKEIEEARKKEEEVEEQARKAQEEKERIKFEEEKERIKIEERKAKKISEEKEKERQAKEIEEKEQARQDLQGKINVVDEKNAKLDAKLEDLRKKREGMKHLKAKLEKQVAGLEEESGQNELLLNREKTRHAELKRKVVDLHKTKTAHERD